MYGWSKDEMYVHEQMGDLTMMMSQAEEEALPVLLCR